MTDAERRAIGVVLLVLAIGACVSAIHDRHPAFVADWIPPAPSSFVEQASAASAPSRSAARAIPSSSLDPRGAMASVDAVDTLSPRAQPSAPSAPERAGDALSPSAPSARVDVNTADETALTSLPSIGPVRARAILDERMAHGPFRRLADLRRVHGIGPITLRRLAPYLTFGPGSPRSARARSPSVGRPSGARPTP